MTRGGGRLRRGNALLGVALALAACSATPRPAASGGATEAEAPARPAAATSSSADPFAGMDAAAARAAAQTMDRAGLEAAYAASQPDSVGARAAAARLARIAAHAGESDAAARWRRRAGDEAPAPPPKTRLAPIRVAVLLPLSGPHRRIGAELRAAVEVARRDAGAAAPGVYDTRGTEAGAAAAARAAAADGANLIVGPVGERASRAAAAVAVRRGVPIALLAPAERGAAPAIGVYRLWPSDEREAALAARYAVDLGYESLAVFAPRDELGAARIAAFTAAARDAGAQVVRAATYDPTATELEPDVKALLGLDPMTNARLRRHLRRRGRKRGWKTFSPDVDFELLYIPDRYDRAALVASYLPYFNVELRAGGMVDTLALRRKHGGHVPSVVQLLGSSGWHHPGLIPRGGDAVDGALLVARCVGGPDEDYADDFAARVAGRLRRAIGREPTALARQGYDAARLVFDRVAERGRSGRDILRGARLAQGACGPATIDADGQLRRRPQLLRVDGDQLVLHEW